MSDRQLFQTLLLNLLIGATAGAVFCATLLFLDVHDVARTLQCSSSPIAATTILMTAASMYFAFGAAVTGFYFAITDEL